jgi:hypothetical protein
MKHQLKIAGAFALLITLMWSSSAVAILQGLDLQTQLQYRMLDIKSGDTPASSFGGFSTAYSLSLRQPLTPLAKLTTNLSINSLANSDEFGKQQNSNVVFNLSSYERTYTLTMGYVRNGFRTVQTSAGQVGISTGDDSSYDLSFFMREPSYPAVNF